MAAPNIVYKTLGFKYLNRAFCPALAFVSADRNEARNPQRFIHAAIRTYFKKKNMKKLTLISTLILLTFISCNNTRTKDNQEQKQETPKVLQDEKSYEIVSKRDYDDVIESLYKELADKAPELKDLETNLHDLSASKSDSTEQFDKYNGKNRSYYNSADSHIERINDSTLRKKMKELISSSLTKYDSKVYQHTELLKSIDKKTMTLNDLHEVLIITTTLPLIEKYQNDNLPATKSINGYLKQLDKAVQIENSLLEKKEKKE